MALRFIAAQTMGKIFHFIFGFFDASGTADVNNGRWVLNFFCDMLASLTRS